MDYNKLEVGEIKLEFTEINLHKIGANINKIHLSLAKEKGVNFSFEFDEKIHLLVMADQTRIYQVLNNLINNALKLTSKGYVKLNCILLDSDDKIQTIRTEVLDSGIGISEDKQTIIFEQFTQASSSTTRKYGGTGLGLSIVKKILNTLDIKINCKSKPGSGTTF